MQVQVERPRRSEDERPGGRRRLGQNWRRGRQSVGRNPPGRALPSRPRPGCRLDHLRLGSLVSRACRHCRSQNVGQRQGEFSSGCGVPGRSGRRLAGRGYTYPGSGEGRVKPLCGRAGGCGLGGVRLGSAQPGHCIDKGHQIASQRTRLAHAVASRAAVIASNRAAARSWSPSGVWRGILPCGVREARS